ncbi:MAG: hypothetical protein WBG36_09085 [Ornithinimicrobium sp.]
MVRSPGAVSWTWVLNSTMVRYTLSTDTGDIEAQNVISPWQNGEELAYRTTEFAEEPF